MVSGYPTSTNFPWVDGLSMDPRDLGCHNNIRAASQTVMITAQSTKPSKKGQSEQKGNQTKDQKRSREQSERKREPP